MLKMCSPDCLEPMPVDFLCCGRRRISVKVTWSLARLSRGRARIVPCSFPRSFLKPQSPKKEWACPSY